MENILSELFIYIQSILSILCEIFHVKSPIFGVFAWNISHILCQTVGSTQEYILWWEIRSVTETDLPILWGQLYESIYSLTYAYVLREYILYLVRRMTHQPSWINWFLSAWWSLVKTLTQFMAIKLIEIQAVFFPLLIWRGVKISCLIGDTNIAVPKQTLQRLEPAISYSRFFTL